MTALDEIGRCGVVPVVSLDSVDQAAGLAEALIAGGLPCAEVVFRTPAALAVLERLAGDRRLLVGAGTVLTPEQVDTAVAAGARFIVSPGFDADVVRRSQALGVPAIPGIATPTEVMRAVRAGVDTVKLFPARVIGGLEMLKALSAPFPGLRFIPTGGIDHADLSRYAGQPSVLAVGGSWITPPTLLRAGRFDEIAALAAAAVAAVVGARAGAGSA